MHDHPLEPGRDDMEAMGQAALALLADLVDGLDRAPAGGAVGTRGVEAGPADPPAEGPGRFDDLLERYRSAAGHAVETAGPGYLAYIPGGGLYTSALGELLARGLNRYTGLASFAPSLVALEDGVLSWLCRTFGLPRTAVGQITTGGSMATLTAVVAAREDRLGRAFADGTLYVTEHTHRCVTKMARVAGIAPDRIRTVPTDRRLRMDPGAASRMMGEDRAAGLRPFLLAATAGTTDTGAVDPLPELADVAAREGAWFHVDAAYGGFFHLTERGRARFTGIERADSLVLDPHKGLFLAYGTGVLLARDRAALEAAFAAEGSYLQDAGGTGSLPNYADLGPELTRDQRGLRLWLPLHLHGVAAFRAALDEKLDLARLAHRELSADPRLAVPWEPELSTVAFHVAADPDGTMTRDLLAQVNAADRVVLSSTRIRGRYVIRLCVLSHRTHAEHVVEAVEIVRAALDRLVGRGPAGEPGP